MVDLGKWVILFAGALILIGIVIWLLGNYGPSGADIQVEGQEAPTPNGIDKVIAALTRSMLGNFKKGTDVSLPRNHRSLFMGAAFIQSGLLVLIAGLVILVGGIVQEAMANQGGGSPSAPGTTPPTTT